VPPQILLASLQSLAQQSFSDFECVLVDESIEAASLECAAAFCKADPRFRHVIPSERLGLAGSLNLAIQEARAPIVARFDSDDICMPNRLELQIAMMNKMPELGVLGGGLEIMNSDCETLAYRSYPQSHNEVARALHIISPLAHPTVMMRKSVVLAAGGYDPYFRYAEDIDLWLRILKIGGRFGNLPDVLVRYRQNSVIRSAAHWRYNFRARARNFSRPYIFRRLVGLTIVGLWSSLPQAIQRMAFHKLLLSGQP
jgi:glycosyltransferase involved in cell wall biosynthesis